MPAFLEDLLDVAIEPLAVVARQVFRRDDDDRNRAPALVAAELGDEFSLERALKDGMLPLALASANPEKVLDAYSALYVREEVQAEGLVRNISSFSRFLESISFSHGSVLNVSNVARECAVSRKTVESYVEIMEDLLLSFRVSVFTKRAQRGLVAHPKFFYFDTGVFRTLRPRGPLDSPAGIDGAALEGLIAQHLRAWSSYSSDPHELFYWRTRWGLEVDFVLYGPSGLWAIEVKTGSTPRPEDLRGLQEFQADYPEARCALLYRGKDRLKIGAVLCIPCDEFLRGLLPNQPPIH